MRPPDVVKKSDGSKDIFKRLDCQGEDAWMSLDLNKFICANGIELITTGLKRQLMRKDWILVFEARSKLVKLDSTMNIGMKKEPFLTNTKLLKRCR